MWIFFTKMPRDLNEDPKLSHTERVGYFIKFESHESRESCGQTVYTGTKQKTKSFQSVRTLVILVFAIFLVFFLFSVVRNLFLTSTIRKVVLIITSPQPIARDWLGEDG